MKALSCGRTSRMLASLCLGSLGTFWTLKLGSSLGWSWRDCLVLVGYSNLVGLVTLLLTLKFETSVLKFWFTHFLKAWLFLFVFYLLVMSLVQPRLFQEVGSLSLIPGLIVSQGWMYPFFGWLRDKMVQNGF
jgi:hypothetical protein